METAEIRDLISAFVPEEILRDFELKEVKKECGVYRLYMDEKDDESHYPPELAEAKEVVRCGYMNPCEIQTFPIAGCEAFIYIRRVGGRRRVVESPISTPTNTRSKGSNAHRNSVLF